mmetsp:Transcript_27918/g.76833  ORF Transcript_27918/g.76833 Transcript_27918/m.76833 type:complete len:207 (-) Transcript_27918:2721-3341(-)
MFMASKPSDRTTLWYRTVGANSAGAGASSSFSSRRSLRMDLLGGKERLSSVPLLSDKSSSSSVISSCAMLCRSSVPIGIEVRADVMLRMEGSVEISLKGKRPCFRSSMSSIARASISSTADSSSSSEFVWLLSDLSAARISAAAVRLFSVDDTSFSSRACLLVCGDGSRLAIRRSFSSSRLRRASATSSGLLMLLGNQSSSSSDES